MVEQEPEVENSTALKQINKTPPLFFGGAGVAPLALAACVVSIVFLFFGSILRPAISGAFDALIKHVDSAESSRHH